MKLHIKAALLSGLILPGIGQLYKGSRIKGMVLIVCVNILLLAALFVILPGLGKLALARAVGEQAGIAAVTAYISNYSPYGKTLLALFALLWCYGVTDAACSSAADSHESP